MNADTGYVFMYEMCGRTFLVVCDHETNINVDIGKLAALNSKISQV